MKQIKDGIFCHISKDTDRRLFDQLVPIPEGTTYNSYLVIGSEKTALIDTVYPKKCEDLLSKLEKLGIKHIDYIVANHGEQDHTGSLAVFLEKFKGVKIVTNQKCKDNIVNFLHIADEHFIIIKDGETLSLGSKTLKFFITPWVHWPDTMMTYIVEDKLLSTCDFFGAHYTDSDLYSDDTPAIAAAMKRYYSEIMMPYRNFCAKYVKLVKDIAPDMIMPSHGPVYQNPQFPISNYDVWTSPKAANKVVIPFVSMYESTRILVDELKDALEKRGIETIFVDLAECDEGELAMEILDALTIVIGVSMVLAGPHPRAVYAAYLANILRPKAKFYSIIGSYGWGGNLTSVLQSLLETSRMELIEPVIAKGKPLDADIAKIRGLAEVIALRHESYFRE